MKKLVLITLLGLCSLVFAANEFSEADHDIVQEQPFITKYSEKQIECLARNMYFEAKSESDKGVSAVGFVTMNRVADGNFPSTICGVVHQKLGEVCQFSWVCILGKNPHISDPQRYHQIKNMARIIAENHKHIRDKDPSKGSLFFHATYIQPNWNLKRKVRIGMHVFYSRN
jgi:N-acetylmuramoyl-L-alanine amidase